MNSRTLASALALVCASCMPQDQHVLRHGETTLSSSIRRETAVWTLPFHKTYQELTSEEKARLRAAYTNLGDNDEPPYPLRGMRAIAEPLSEAQQTMLQRGRIFAVASIDANGDVQKVAFFEQPNEDTARVVGWILVRTKFKPALCNGAPCAMDYPVQIDLRVKP